MNQKVTDLLAAKKPSKRGIHGTANCYSAAEYYRQQLEDFTACGFSWLKLLVAGDSGLNTVKMLARMAPKIIPVVRFWYGPNPYPNASLAPDLVKPYVDAGVVLFDIVNESYNEWSGGSYDTHAQVDEWASMASSVLNAGGVPLTPSIEGWHFYDIFLPFLDDAWNRHADLVKASCIAGHWRTLNHPVLYDKDPGGYRGWEWFDKAVFEKTGEHLPLIGTEAGPEPGDNQDKTFPLVTPQRHEQMVKEMLTYPTPAHYLADCLWLWEDGGTFNGASYVRNRQWANGLSLPVVDTLKTWQPDIPPSETTLEDTIVAAVRQRVGYDSYPWLTKVAARRGYIKEPLTGEFKVDYGSKVYLVRAFGNVALYCPDGEWTDEKTMEVKWL